LPDLGVHLSSIPVTGKCGPDVTDAVAKTLAEVETTFSDDHNPKYLPPDTPDMHRYSACQALYAPVAGVGGSGTAWDIRPLITLGNRNIPRDLPTGLESADFPVAGTCGGTVVYQGLCRWASAVNYALWGKANRLCHDKFGNRPFTIQTGNPLKPTWTVSWSLLDTQAAVIWRKMSQSVGGYFGNSEAQWAEIFAIGGYCGTSYPIQTDEIITCGTKGVKKWPNAPMVWQWSGVHDPY